MHALTENTSTQVVEMTSVQAAEFNPSREVQNYPEANTSVWSFYFKSKTNSNDRFDS